LKIQLNGETRELPEHSSVRDLLDALDRDFGARSVAVAVNLQVVPAAEHAARLLEDEDRVDLVTAVGGG